jgi:transposase
MRNVALDLGARTISYCEVKDGRVEVRRTVSDLSTLDDLLGGDAPKARVAIEACREAWHIHSVLTERGHEVLLVDTTRVKQVGIGQHGRKTDRIDAEVLARALYEGRLPLAHVLSPERRELRTVLSIRRSLVEARANFVTDVRGILRAQGQKIAQCATEHFAKRVRSQSLPEELFSEIEPLVTLVESLDERIAGVDARLEALCANEPIIAVMTTAPGVGLIVAASLVSVLDDAKRFRNAHQVQSYLGLVPGEDTSGGKRKLGAITKHGNGYVRAMLVQAGWSILRLADRHDPLRVWAEQVIKRRGKRIGVVALARRLAGILWAMWRDGTAYDAEWVGKHSQRGLEGAVQDAKTRAQAMKRAAEKAKVRTRSQRRPAAVSAA